MVTPSSVFPASPDRVLPGPHSMKVSKPSAFMFSRVFVQRTGLMAC